MTPRVYYPTAMKRSPWFHRLTILLASVTTLALFLTVSAPHSHDTSSISHQASTCRACRIQEGFVATPSTPAVVAHQPILVTRYFRGPFESPRATLVLRP